jgi:hypothetical protein
MHGATGETGQVPALLFLGVITLFTLWAYLAAWWDKRKAMRLREKLRAEGYRGPFYDGY